MMEDWKQVWVIDKGDVLDMPVIKKGLILDTSETEFLIRHEDNSEVVYSHQDVFWSLSVAVDRRKTLMGKRANILRQHVSTLENCLAASAA